jgi:hypothetical protein
MIAVDSSTFIHGLNGVLTEQVSRMRRAIAEESLLLPLPVITEVLSFARAAADLEQVVDAIPRLAMRDGFWERAGQSRRLILAQGLKAKLGDTLVAQACIDADVALITGDADFRHFAIHCGLKLAV